MEEDAQLLRAESRSMMTRLSIHSKRSDLLDTASLADLSGSSPSLRACPFSQLPPPAIKLTGANEAAGMPPLLGLQQANNERAEAWMATTPTTVGVEVTTDIGATETDSKASARRFPRFRLRKKKKRKQKSSLCTII
ncbi:PREDICTED: uncharacterized protein LOC106818257 [Priapulus caudatus]|uniref:Uncharacterized protein LOC106818257 n=1 Tax=Priapulus caudatus TaxID=37621 RepID=A0ABM1F1Z3_PRICU|nr:PREDICTED: uncharacterized protein LOC106818257 [Priapulus caudatus]